MKYNYIAIGDRIRSERNARGWSQDRLIEKLSDINVTVCRNTLSKLENGVSGKETPLALLLGLCQLFDCELGYLLCDPEYRDNRTRQRSDVQAVTGLNEAAIHQLEMLKENSVKMPIAKQMIDTLNAVLSDPDCMSDLLETLGGYIGTCEYYDSTGNVPGLSDLGINSETNHFMRIAAACGQLKQLVSGK